MKRITIFLCLGILFAVPLFSDELWYQAYENALKAIKRGDYKTAEQKLKIALKQEPGNQKKNRKYYGVNATGDYFPDYYLGVVYFNEKRFAEAEAQFQKAEQMDLQKEDSSRYAEMQSYVAKMKEIPNGEQPVPSSVDVAQQAKQETEGHINKAKQLAEDGDLEKAEAELELARKKDPSNDSIKRIAATIKQKRAGNLEKEIRQKIESGDLQGAESSIKQIQDLDPAYPALAELKNRLSRKNSE